jgi:hypothetical protein
VPPDRCAGGQHFLANDIALEKAFSPTAILLRPGHTNITGITTESAELRTKAAPESRFIREVFSLQKFSHALSRKVEMIR